MSMKNFKMWSIACTIGVILGLLFSVPSFASLGKIAGKVTDAATGEALAGAQIQIVGTTMGAAANPQGEYFILNVPPGTYTLRVSFMGYTTQEFTDVISQQDVTTTVDVALKQTVIEGEVISVVAERPIVDKTMTATRINFTPSTVDNVLPSNTLEGVLQTSVTVSDMRGANKVGVGYLIDGVNVTDALWPVGGGTNAYTNVKHDATPLGDATGVFDNQTAISGRKPGLPETSGQVAMGQVQEVDVIAGTINAEYAASGGIINLASRSGGSQLSAKLFLRSSLGGLNHAGPNVYTGLNPNYFGGLSAEEQYDKAAAVVRADTSLKERAGFFDWYPGKYPYGDDPRINAELNIGGPLTSKGNFFFSGYLLNDHGRFPGEFQRLLTTSLKLNYSLTPTNKLTGMVKIDDGGKLLGWKNRQYTFMYSFFLEGQPVNDKLNTMSYLKWTKTFDPSSFLESTVSYVTADRTYGYAPVKDANGNLKLEFDNYGDYLILDTVDKVNQYMLGINTRIFNQAPGNDQYHQIDAWQNQIRIGRPGYLYEDISTSVLNAKADFVKQVNFNHQLKAGGEFKYVSIDNFQHGSSVGYYAWDPTFVFETVAYKLNPWAFGTYIQDRIEYQGIIVNAGVRLDGYDMGSKLPVNLFNPVIKDTLPNSQILGRPKLGPDAKTRLYVSPRLGISHPITENAAMHYSWGIYTTPPAYIDAFRVYDVFANSSLPVYYDADPDPEVATAYEIGLNVAFARDYGADLTAYYRDTRNAGYTGFTIHVASGSGFALMNYQTTWGYRDSRGIELNLFKRSSPERYFGFLGLSGRLSVSYSYDKPATNASSISPLRGTSDLYAGTQDEQYDFNNRYTWPSYSRGFNYWKGKLTLLFDFPMDIQMSTITTYNSAWYYQPVTRPINLRYNEYDTGDYFLQTDVRLTKRLTFGKYSAGVFFEALNVFDRLNVLTFDNYNSDSQARYENTGQPWGVFNRPVDQYGNPFAGIARELYAGIEFYF
jgi:hypothetical protein